MDKYNHWIGKLFSKAFNHGKPYAVTISQTTYYSCHAIRVTSRWRRHENCHQSQQKSDGMFSFVLVYVWQWITRGYDNVDYEIEARKAELS